MLKVTPFEGAVVDTWPKSMSNEPAATNVPVNALSATDPSACTLTDWSMASAGIRLLAVEGTVVALSQSMRSSSERLVRFARKEPDARRSTLAAPINAALVRPTCTPA